MSGSLRTPSVWSLPWHTLRLAGRCVLPLTMWYSAGQLARFGLLVGATELSHGSMRDLRLTLTMLVFIVMVMVSLVVTVGMFYSLRGALTEMRARRADGEDEGFAGSLSRVIIPFVVLYLSWGWHTQDVRDFINVDRQRQSGELGYLGALTDFGTGQAAGTGRGLIDLGYDITLGFMIVTFVARYFLALWYERENSSVAAFGTAFCELAFFYFGAQVIMSRGDWLGSRVAMSWLRDLGGHLGLTVPGWDAFWSLAGQVLPYAWDALVLSAAWLTVAILMYGAYAEDAQAVIKGTRLESKAENAGRALVGRTHSMTRRTVMRLFGRWAHWVAVIHTVRLTVRGGAPLFGLFALCFVLLRIGEGYAWRGLVYLMGTDHPLLYWNVLVVPIDFVVDLVLTVLTTCLLAATFDIAAGAERRRRAQAHLNDRTTAQGPTPPAPDARSSTASARPGLPVPSVPRSPG